MVLLVASSSVALGERFERAVAYAIAARRDRRRPASEVPYVAHLFGVCAIVLEHGGSESEAISALLSGTIDDEHRPEHLKVIRNGFGDDVAAIVDGCTGVSAARAGEGPPLAFYDRTQVAIDASAVTPVVTSRPAPRTVFSS